jgi:demethylphylloquinol methyltransferase
LDHRTQDDSVTSRNYDAVAGFYETAAHLYSFGLIKKGKLAQLDRMPPGARVLYLGAGSGEDAIAAAAAGHDVTAIDLSARMGARLERRLARRGLSATVLVGDVMRYAPQKPFDVVCGNYFFNVFPAGEVERVVARATTFLSPGGVLMVADMAPQEGALAPLGWLYLKAGLSFFWALGLASQHPIYDYAEIGQRLGLGLVDRRDFGPPGLPLYRTVALTAPGAGDIAR